MGVPNLIDYVPSQQANNLAEAARRMAQPLLCCVMAASPAPAYWVFLTVR